MFTPEQVGELLANENVTSCSERSITFQKAFKTAALSLYQVGGLGPQEIFQRAGFNLGTIGIKRCRACLSRWRRVYRNKGSEGLAERRGRESKGRVPHTVDRSDADKIKRLETEVAYLKAENDFLAKLRAKRAE